MLTDKQIAAGRAVQRELKRAEENDGIGLLRSLHRALAELRDSFRSDLSDDQYQAFGGGTPKTPPPDEGGD